MVVPSPPPTSEGVNTNTKQINWSNTDPTYPYAYPRALMRSLSSGAAISGKNELEERLQTLADGNWLVEERIFGREVTIGVLNNETLGIVEVIPVGGVYDFDRKYTHGSTEYRFPAIIDPETEVEIKDFALRAYQSCGCRDFARVDFIICDDGHAHFLEINTLPGLTQTSLLPKSASSSGYNFDQLTKKLISPAIDRYNNLTEDDAPCAA